MSAQASRAATRTPTLFHALILLCCICFAVLASAILGPVLPAMQASFHDVPHVQTLVPLVVTVPMLVLAALSTLAGALSDRVGRKRLLVGALALYGVCGTAPLWLDSLDAILVSRFGVGLAESAIMATSTALVGDYWSGTQRDRYMALQTTIAAVSAFVFNTLGGVLGQHGWRTPFGMYSLSLLLLPLVVFYIWEPQRGAAGAGPAAGDAERAFRPALLAWNCFVAVVVGVAFMIVPVHMGFLLVDIGTHEPQRIGLVYACNSAAVAAGTLAFGWYIAGRLRVSVQMMLSTAIAGAGFLLMAEAHDYQAMLLGGMVNGFGCGIFLPMSVTWTMRELPRARLGLGAGAFFASFFLGNFVNPLIVVPMMEQLGTRAAAVQGWGWILLGVACAAGLFAALRTRAARAALVV